MSYPNIVSDWNGTIFSHPTDEQLNKAIAYAVFDDAKRHFRIGKLAKLLKAQREIGKRMEEYRQGRATVVDVYEPFNEYVVRGTKTRVIRKAVEDFARQYIRQLDEGLLGVIETAHQNGAHTGILSSSYDHGIIQMLREVNAYFFDFITANALVFDGKTATHFFDAITGRKAEHMQERFRISGIRERNTVYIGDTSEDEPIAEMLPAGHFVVPFFANPEFREHTTSKYRAFAPATPEELNRYLQGLL